MDNTSSIVAFFTGEAADDLGRLFSDYLNFSNSELEHIHNYIQWAFPICEPSRHNSSAPLLTDDAVAALKENPDALKNFQIFLARMSQFYLQSDCWLSRFNHNHLRITRIIASTCQILNVQEAGYFYAMIMQRIHDTETEVNKRSIDFWKDTLEYHFDQNDH